MLSAKIRYDLRMSELKEVYDAGCISNAEFLHQALEYWLLLKNSN